MLLLLNSALEAVTNLTPLQCNFIVSVFYSGQGDCCALCCRKALTMGSD